MDSDRAAAFFDLDKTIIAGSSTLAFSGPMRARGLIDRRTMLRSGWAQLLLMVAGADAGFMERIRRRISALCVGWDVAEVREVIELSLPSVLTPMIYAEAVELIGRHRGRGHHVAVVSASGAEMVAPVAAALGAEHCVATRMVVVDGRYTGEIEFYCYGEGKAAAARQLAAEHDYHLPASFAYSDSITDLPLLEAVGHPRAVNPDRALRRVATRRGWPVLDFTAPVSPRVRAGARLRSLLAEVVGGTGVAGWGGRGAAALVTALAMVIGSAAWRGLRRQPRVTAEDPGEPAGPTTTRLAARIRASHDETDHKPLNGRLPLGWSTASGYPPCLKRCTSPSPLM